MRNLRAWDDVAQKMVYGKVEQFDDALLYRFEHFETEKPIYMDGTGLNDHNGTEIFDGDVVTAREKSDKATFTGYVYFLNGQYWVSYIGYESYYVPLIQLVNAEYEPIKVIGNIHEHPQLLEGTK